MVQLLILASVFVCVATLIGGVAVFLRSNDNPNENRLTEFIQNKKRTASKSAAEVLLSPLDDAPTKIEEFISRYFNLGRYIEQSGMNLNVPKFLGITGGLAGAGFLISMVVLPIKVFAPMIAVGLATLPIMAVWWKRRSRLRKFGASLPEALELISRALRAGHSLPAGIQLVAQQMSEPLGPEFGRCYEQQNLGIPLEDALKEMTDRVPNLDLKFFVTAVLLQRQTGGDLAEILDKIGKLIRERFQIWGQIQALTGEGRLSGIVLLALPPALFLVMLKLNYDYVMLLFEDPIGIKMLIGGIIMQVLGAIAIKKIITIKV